MGCVDCQKQDLPPNNKVDFTAFMELFPNPKNVAVENLKIVRYKKWFIQAEVSYNDTVEVDGELTTNRVKKVLTLGEIN
jgi:hypothetical protein